ncbi:DNA polymerase [Vibrio litoralis]|uniref:DNA polymerase n=1 Tax=Vibrio litoralis TaxID=335972 RepID=UPI00146E0E8C|nr:DNA polymerase [Vibrio litoralis]
MSKGKVVFLVYQKDFSESGKDRYFIFDNESLFEVTVQELVSYKCFIVTHDFWLISSSIYKSANVLPNKIIDVVLLAKIVSGVKSVTSDTQPWDISKTIKPIFSKSEDFNYYMDVYYRRKSFDFDIYLLFAHKLCEYFESLSETSYQQEETSRFYSLELPVYNLMTLAVCRGIKIDNETFREHKENLQLDFYRELKKFSEKHDVLYELPKEGDIREKLITLNYHVDGVSIDFLLDFIPSIDGYTDDLRRLQKINKSYQIFNSISSSSNRLHPIVESHWTSTSRIYYKSPAIQNIAKKYRDIFIPDAGKILSYVDYDQFEIGVMAYISKDPMMIEIYTRTDAYSDFAIKVFNDKNKRKSAKVIFLSYVYGMSMDNIKKSTISMGGNSGKLQDYFEKFEVFESWKQSVWKEFESEGRIGTIKSNYLKRAGEGKLTEKEKRISVNHVIQGTATYIFKLALLEVSKVDDIDILIPMHDAALIQHTEKVSSEKFKEIFENVMTEVLPGIQGKASLEDFYISE